MDLGRDHSRSSSSVIFAAVMDTDLQSLVNLLDLFLVDDLSVADFWMTLKKDSRRMMDSRQVNMGRPRNYLSALESREK